MNRREIPFHKPSIGQEEIDEVTRTLESGWLTTGPRTAQFEEAFRQYTGAAHAQAVNSCTAGLHLALEALGIGPGMEVITTPLTFCATVNMILRVRATPVLADVGPDGNIDLESVLSRISPKTRAIMPVHLAGLPCELDRLWRLARERGLFIIEDAAHAAGARYRELPIGAGLPSAGTYSDAAVFSFYATKNLTTGEGGMVTTQSATIAETVRTLCLHGLSKNAWNRYSAHGRWYYEVLVPGFKYNLTDIQSSIGLHQLKKLEGFIETRTRYARLYNELLADVEEIELPPDRPDCRHSWHLYIPRLNLNRIRINRDELIEALQERGIGASVHFIPIPLHPFFAAYAARPENYCPRALALYPRLVSLPLYPAMSEGDIEYVASAVKAIVRGARTKRPVSVLAAATGRLAG